MSRLGGARRKRSGILSKSTRQKGKMSMRTYLQELEVGDKVTLKLEPAVQGGMYLPRFHGKVGIVKKRQGECYQVQIQDGAKQKTVVVHPIHLKKTVSC